MDWDVVWVAASVVQTFHLTPYAVARSLASQQMGEDEQGQSSYISYPAKAEYVVCLSLPVCPSVILWAG